MNAEAQQNNERQKIGQAKFQRGGLENRTPATTTTRTTTTPVPGVNSVHEDGGSSSRIVVDTRKIKKERNSLEASNENGIFSGNVNNHVTGNNERETITTSAGTSENGHQNSRSNSVCRNISNGYHTGDILHDIIATKLSQNSGATHGNSNKNDKIRIMIEDSLSEDSKNRVQEIYLKVEQLKHEEKLLLYLRMPGCLTSAVGTVDPLRQPLNPLGNRYEIHQTIMWIKTHLEEDPDVSLPKQEVYDEYNMFCIRNAMKPLSTADFGKVMKQVYPRVRPRRLGTRGNSRYCYAGMRKRVKLDTPTLPPVTDTSVPDEFEEPITEEMLGAASTLIREWAESLLKMKFPTLSALARHLVDNLRVDTRSLAAVCILCASGDAQPSSNNKVSESSPSLSVTPVAGKPGKLREAQLQLQRKLQQREHIRDQKNRNQEATPQNSSKETKCTESVNTTPTNSAITSGRSSSASKGCKKSKTSSQSPQGSGGASSTGATATGTTTTPGGSGKSSSQPAATTPSPASGRNRKLARSVSQASVAISAQLTCDNNVTQCRINDDIRGNNSRLSRSCDPSEVSLREGKLPVKNSRKRASLEHNNQSSETSPEKQAKLMSEVPIVIKREETTTTTSTASTKLPPVPRPDKITLLLPSNVKIGKTEGAEVSPTKKVTRVKEIETSNEKTLNGRSGVYENLGTLNRIEDKLCTIDPDALDDYLNGGNNSQEQEEELLQYFQQSSSSSSDAEVANPLSNAEADQASRSDKVSQLRLILQQNLKAGTARSANSTDSGVVMAARRETPVAEVNKGPTIKQHDIVLPILVNHPASQASGGTRRRVSFETSVVEQHQHHENLTNASGSTSALNTVPQSPNTRRRIFNFTPISPGPHSPINGRTASASKPNSANASPFVSPRNTPVPRSRSNLQGGICRSRGNLKSLARSISCSVPYSVRNETFVVPTSNADSCSRLISSSASQSALNCPKATAEVQVGGSIIHGSQGIADGAEEEQKVIAAAGCTASFLAGGDLNPQKQLLINYPSQENLQEIKNVYGSVGTSTVSVLAGHQSRNSQPAAADQEISELLNGAVKQQSFTTEQLFYRSQSVPLHRMVNPTLMSPIGQHHQYLGAYQSHSFNHSSNSSIAPTPVPSEFNDFGSIAPSDTYLLDDVDAGFIADDQQFLMEDKESITKILNILDEEGRQSLTIMPDRGAVDDNLIEGAAGLSISMLDPLPNSDLGIPPPPETIIDAAVVLDPSVGANIRKIIDTRSYTNTPLATTTITNNSSFVQTNNFNDDTNDASRSYPSTPLHAIQPDVYRESNEPMLSSPTLNSLNLRSDNGGDTTTADNVCRNVSDLLESNFLGDPDGDNDDLGNLGNFDGLQDVDSLTPLFNEVADNNR